MLVDRQIQEARECATLAPYAQKVAESAGRRFAEPLHPFRTEYQRDRARIIHTRSFRRLEYKTQVFLNGSGDHLRTRLTHTVEVASISRAIARTLGANEDLAEAIALAHDLGHAPLGHAGEEVLNRLMDGHGGFEHNQQSLRIVETIEQKYPGVPGLNLTYEVLEGLRKHEGGHDRPATAHAPAESFPWPSLEGQIANLADEITYYSHDLDDGLEHGLIDPNQLKELELWELCVREARSRFPGISGEMLQRYAIRTLIDHEVDQFVQATHRRLADAGAGHADDVRRSAAMLAGYPQALKRQNAQLRKFLYQNLYFHPEVSVPNSRACEAIELVFGHYLKHPGELGEGAARRLEEHGLHRAVCDYVSGMTDRFLLDAAAALAN